VAVDAAGNIYISQENSRIRKVDTSGIITTIAGMGIGGFSGDGGPSTKAALLGTEGLGLDSAGNLYIADSGNNRVRKIAATQGTGIPPSINPGGVVSASAYGEFTTAAPGSWIEIYGSGLAVDTREWGGSDFDGVNAPTSLDGTSVTIGGIQYVVACSPMAPTSSHRVRLRVSIHGPPSRATRSFYMGSALGR